MSIRNIDIGGNLNKIFKLTLETFKMLQKYHGLFV